MLGYQSSLVLITIFFKALGIKLAAGRFFLRENTAGAEGAFIINETAAKQLNTKGSVVGREIIWDHDEDRIHGTVIGVVKDFHFESLHEPIRPLLFVLSKDQFNHILIKMSTKNFDQKIAAIEKAYKTAEPYFGFEFTFLQDSLNQQYAAEKRTGLIVGVFSIIAIYELMLRKRLNNNSGVLIMLPLHFNPSSARMRERSKEFHRQTSSAHVNHDSPKTQAFLGYHGFWN